MNVESRGSFGIQSASHNACRLACAIHALAESTAKLSLKQNQRNRADIGGASRRQIYHGFERGVVFGRVFRREFYMVGVVRLSGHGWH